MADLFKMVDVEQLRAWRAAGVESVEIGPETSEPCSRPSVKVKFFPRELTEMLEHPPVESLIGARSERDTEAPPPGPKMPPALARIFEKGSVS